MEYKSRLLLENTFKVNKESKLLLCFSGGLNSIAMVTIIHNIFKKYQKNKLFHSLACVHVQQQSPLTPHYLQLFK
jgi:tRNA(Ile)-lysidine synthase TilS/MesJ